MQVNFSNCIVILLSLAKASVSLQSYRRMVSFHGRVSLHAKRRIGGGLHHVDERPPDPRSLLSEEKLEEKAEMLMDWWQGKKSIFCITGAGLSTDSGIPDYRGHKGSYHRGHKPMIHQHFVDSEYQRKRYWGRAMVGWSKFDAAQPNKGHFALADLERMGRIGVDFADKPTFYEPEETDEYYFSSGQQQLAILTQNVDSLHQRAGSKHVVQLHGGNSIVKCMQCGKKQDRNEFHTKLESMNHEWLANAMLGYEKSSDLRPDGDAVVKEADYNHVHVPNCPHCKTGFLKPDVVFFGDTVPKHRVALCQEAVEMADGILVVGSSLAVHSAFRHVRAATMKGTPVAILNVGETRAETENLEHVLKIEAPASDTLERCVRKFSADQSILRTANI